MTDVSYMAECEARVEGAPVYTYTHTHMVTHPLDVQVTDVSYMAEGKTRVERAPVT